ERAEEFVQESTLFTDNVTIRRSPRGGDTTTGSVTNGSSSTNAPATRGSEIVSRGELVGKGQQEQFELQYRQRKADLQAQAKDIQEKITELQKRGRELVVR